MQICCSVEELFCYWQILTQRGTFSQLGQGSLFLSCNFKIFDIFLNFKWFERNHISPERFSFKEDFFTPGGSHEYVNRFLRFMGSWLVYNVFARLRIGCLLNLTPLYTFASKKEISISDILAVNMIAE